MPQQSRRKDVPMISELSGPDLAVRLDQQGRRLVQRLRRHGFADRENSILFQFVVVGSNKMAMSLLASGDYDNARVWLGKAFKLTDGDAMNGFGELGDGASADIGPSSLVALRVLTLNNLACYHKEIGELDEAMAHLNVAAKDSKGEITVTDQQNAVTHSNLCAILSEMDHHDLARKHAKIAVSFCKRELGSYGGLGGADTSVTNLDISFGQDMDELEPNHEIKVVANPHKIAKTISSLAVACHNLAVETEFTQGKKCLQWFQRAAELCKVSMAKTRESSPMLDKIVLAYSDARRKWEIPKLVSSMKRANSANARMTTSSQNIAYRLISAGRGAKAVRSMRDSTNTSSNSKVVVSGNYNGKIKTVASPQLGDDDDVLVDESDGGDLGDLGDLDEEGGEDEQQPETENEEESVEGNSDTGPHQKIIKYPPLHRPKSAGDARIGNSRGANSAKERPRTATVAGRHVNLKQKFSPPQRPPSAPRVERVEMSDSFLDATSASEADAGDNVDDAGNDRHALNSDNNVSTSTDFGINAGKLKIAGSSYKSSSVANKLNKAKELAKLNPFPLAHEPKEPNIDPSIAKIQHMKNVHKLIADVQERDSELKLLRWNLKKSQKQHEEKTKFNKQIIANMKAKIELFDQKEKNIRTSCDMEIKAVTEEMDEVKNTNKMMAAKVGRIEHSIEETQRKYVDVCATLAKEKLLRRTREAQTEQAKKDVLSEKSKKHMHTLVYKQQIEILKEAVLKERNQRHQLENTVKESHAAQNNLKNLVAKSKLMERLKKKRQENAAPAFDLNLDSLKDSPLLKGGWISNEVKSDLEYVAASAEDINQSSRLMGQFKYKALCETVDDLEAELSDLYKVKELKVRTIDAIEANVDAASLIAENKEVALHAEVAELTTDLRESEAEVIKLRKELAEANSTIIEWQEYYDDHMREADPDDVLAGDGQCQREREVGSVEFSKLEDCDEGVKEEIAGEDESGSFEESVGERSEGDGDRLSDVD